MSTDAILAQIATDARSELAEWTDAVIARILDRFAADRGGYPSGGDASRPSVRFDDDGNVIPLDHADDNAPISYSDRTGELVASGRTRELTSAERAALMSAARLVRRGIDGMRAIRHNYGILHDHECCKTHLAVGVREPVARGRYARYCRPCGEDRARNDRQDTPRAIMQAIVTGASISDQLIDAHPLPNGKRWKRRPVSVRRAVR